MKTAHLLLSGCGVKDGSEIHEAVLALLALDKAGVHVQCIAPNVQQATTINHLTSHSEPSPKNALVEAARIARGNILPLTEAPDADILVIPGGAGAATTLCSYAKKKENASVLPEVETLVTHFVAAGKPVVAICIAPVILALIYKKRMQLRLTLGSDPSNMQWLDTMGMVGAACAGDSFVYDQTNNIITTPAYMEGRSIAEISRGIDGAVRQAAG